jgi:hypothetical protein
MTGVETQAKRPTYKNPTLADFGIGIAPDHQI